MSLGRHHTANASLQTVKSAAGSEYCQEMTLILFREPGCNASAGAKTAVPVQCTDANTQPTVDEVN
jgi:hypothetical protein